MATEGSTGRSLLLIKAAVEESELLQEKGRVTTSINLTADHTALLSAFASPINTSLCCNGLTFGTTKPCIWRSLED